MSQQTDSHSTAGNHIKNMIVKITKPFVLIYSDIACKAVNSYKATSRAFNRVRYIYKKCGMKEAAKILVNSICRKIQRNNKSIKKSMRKLIPMTAAIAVLLVSLNCWTGFTFALEVEYKGETVGYAANESTVEAACEMLNERIVEDTFDISKTNRELKVVNSKEIIDAKTICENIILASDNLHEAVGFNIDGENYAVCSSKEIVENIIDDILLEYTTGDSTETYSIANDISYINGLYDTDIINDSIDKSDLASHITIMVSRDEVDTVSIPYSTEEINDPSSYAGLETVVNDGKDGLRTIVSNVSYVNGEEVARSVVSETVTQEPVTKVVSIGTKPYPNASETKTGTAFFWPVARVSNSFISAYYGDGRNHKGLDICAPNGTPIYAAEAGTVVKVTSDSGWGKYLVVDHGNGIQTLYSHCSAISASVGQKVNRGDYIAAVGATGNATGYHLHFEVIINGTRVNPASYLGV